MNIAKEEGLTNLNIYGESKLVIEWMQGSRAHGSILLRISLQLAKDLKATFTSVHFHHIYRYFNQEANNLSMEDATGILDPS